MAECLQEDGFRSYVQRRTAPAAKGRGRRKGVRVAAFEMLECGRHIRPVLRAKTNKNINRARSFLLIIVDEYVDVRTFSADTLGAPVW